DLGYVVRPHPDEPFVEDRRVGKGDRDFVIEDHGRSFADPILRRQKKRKFAPTGLDAGATGSLDFAPPPGTERNRPGRCGDVAPQFFGSTSCNLAQSRCSVETQPNRSQGNGPPWRRYVGMGIEFAG